MSLYSFLPGILSNAHRLLPLLDNFQGLEDYYKMQCPLKITADMIAFLFYVIQKTMPVTDSLG